MGKVKKFFRIVTGVVVVGLVLHSADLATRDCRLAPYVYDDCMWVWLRTHFRLPPSKFLRMAVLECVGIVLALILYLTFRYLFPWRRATPPPADPAPPLPAEPPLN